MKKLMLFGMLFSMLGLAAYAQDDPSSWNNYYSNKRYYTPYYDVDKEVNEKMADFKPDSSDITNIKGMYFVREKDASVRPEAVRRYLDAVLSDKDKRQKYDQFGHAGMGGGGGYGGGGSASRFGRAGSRRPRRY